MTKDEFKIQFEYLCLGFDVNPQKKENRMPIYFKTKLNKMNTVDFERLILKAIENLKVDKGHIPTAQQLLALRLGMGSSDNDELITRLSRERGEMSPREIMDSLTPSEEAAMSLCPICDGLGFVIMKKGSYTYSGMTCTCEKGRKKERTTLGQESSCYTAWERLGYEIVGSYGLEPVEKFYRKKSFSEDREIYKAYHEYIIRNGREPESLEQFYNEKERKKNERKSKRAGVFDNP